jgi:steroid 5-alpha reductase family enzyme
MVLDNILVDVIGQLLANKMSKSDPEYKNFKEAYDNVVPYFTERF